MNADDLTRAVLACERARCDALVAGDLAVLERLLSDHLVFVHANATTDTKASLLGEMRGGTIVYQGLTIETPVVLPVGEGAAVLTSRLTADLLVRGEPKRVCNLTLSVWVREDATWRLLAYQPTPAPQ